mmetsp:Transcript_65179/g.113423  ORF Transcript_65179/g.113423 Transcript_65179/m.113423 type:complete len:338 (-) Transcript_65179:16-1029(-)
MHVLTLTLACLACAGNGHKCRVTSVPYTKGNALLIFSCPRDLQQRVERRTSWKALASLLLASDHPLAGWQVTGQSRNQALRHLGGGTGLRSRSQLWMKREDNPGAIGAAATSRRAIIAAGLALSTIPRNFIPAALANEQTSVVNLTTRKVELKSQPKYNISTGDVLTVTSRVYMNISIAGKPAGRLDIELYGDVAPKAAENFRALCTGEKGISYVGSRFYKVVKDVGLQAGDVKGNGLGQSIYGETFEHDNYDIAHSKKGMLSMVNSGLGGGGNTSDSRFLIQPIEDAGYLDGRYEAFGRVYNGLDVIDKISNVKAGGIKKAPLDPITIDAAGEYTP